ncbi:MAG: hypothetical protein ACR650_07975 [Methylocystis sp.]
MATFTKLKSKSWRVQVRRKGKYVNESFLRRRDAEEWALDVERRIDRGSLRQSAREGTPKRSAIWFVSIEMTFAM